MWLAATATSAWWVLAQSGGDGGLDFTDLIERFGFPTVVVLLFVFDRITNTSERDRLRSENAELRRELKDQNEILREKIMPPLVDLTRLLPSVIAAADVPRRRREP